MYLYQEDVNAAKAAPDTVTKSKKDYRQEEEEEENPLMENLTYYEVRRDCVAKDPIIGEVTKLHDNRFQFISVIKTVEKRDKFKLFNNQFRVQPIHGMSQYTDTDT